MSKIDEILEADDITFNAKVRMKQDLKTLLVQMVEEALSDKEITPSGHCPYCAKDSITLIAGAHPLDAIEHINETRQTIYNCKSNLLKAIDTLFGGEK